MRDVAAIMGYKYPNMFVDRGSAGEIYFIGREILYILYSSSDKLGYGLGGLLGNKNLASNMIDRVFT